MAQKKKDSPYLERDISWMYFNERILQEATRPHVPLLERLSFLGIYSNNLDEFFRVRMASQSRIAECGDRAAVRESEHAKKIIKQIGKLNAHYAKAYAQAVEQVTEELKRENICLVDDTEVTPGQLDFIRSYFRERLSGFIVPVWFSAIKWLDYENDENIYLAVKVSRTEPKPVADYAFLEVPVGPCGRFVRLPDHEGRSYLMYLDDVVRCCLPLVFEGLGFTSFEAYTFKFTRDAEMEIDNDLRTGILQKISKGVKSRKRGEPLRVLYDARIPKDLLKRVLRKLDLDSLDTVLASGRYQNHKDFMRFPDCGRADLRYPTWTPILKRELDGPASLLDRIRQKDRFIHVPYHNFDSFIRILQEAAVSKEVESIKITLYRLARESKVVRALIGAARNGKKVTVVIELLARFDEASNINWSKRMQEAGIKVIFGVEGLKVHSKIVHIGMKRGADIACISTGNFHEGNARTYTDCMLMTASRRLVKDVDSVFGFIERPYTPVRFKELLVSPNEMKNRFVALINNEIKNRKSGKPAYIKIKINHITDPVMVEKLYEASCAGVDIDLLVRGNCSLVPGIPGVSDHIRIAGIIDRYLEHSRIFVFAAGGEERVFIGSADWMPRNLDNRVEVVTPVYDPEVKEEMKRIVDFGLRDTLQARIVDGEGKNLFKQPDEGGQPFRSQEALYEYYLNEEQATEE
ncbi:MULTISPECIES: RNA degradosome polyphosphate kinase [Mediterranea]|uniref:RNA degradosome polyphosphate kinase n=1 Tax=Mediterranea TaxID=1926659 RepID=UPI002011B724|nr:MULTISPECIES: RNA degradosome polyphosphate kinase [Mediterranea]MCL1606917.1 RNA degradosome polyphosphate kinase [Mediterranea sp. ET5]MDM8121807.1 RNA degradosome polyphosphate kinase [Mediterranea massiliensis]MDM8197428.1 RNA degradosome polyphosphate kinase [Mediterranea massiliensis]